MADIGLSALNSSTLFELARVKRQLAVATTRIETGLRVSTPAEGVDAFFDATGLTYDAIRLLTIKDNITDAATITGSTVSSLDSITNVVNQMKTQALAARASSVSTTVTGDVVVSASADITDTLAGAIDGDSFNITYDGTTTTITNNINETFDDLAAQITAISGLTATVSDGNALIITAADGQDITIADNVNNLATDLGLSSSTNGIIASTVAIEAAEVEYDVLRSKINTIVGEASSLGTNLISTNPDDLTVYFNEDGTTSITISGVASDANSLSISAINDTNGFSTDAGIDAAIAELDAALTTLSQTKASLKSSDVIFDTRLDFTENLIDLMAEGITKLTAANLNEETAEALALQTRHDLTVAGVGLLFQNGAGLTSLLKVAEGF